MYYHGLPTFRILTASSLFSCFVREIAAATYIHDVREGKLKFPAETP